MRLKVRVSNPMYPNRDKYAKYMTIPPHFDYEGELLPTPKSNPNFVFSLKDVRTGFVREIKIDRIVCGWRF